MALVSTFGRSVVSTPLLTLHRSPAYCVLLLAASSGGNAVASHSAVTLLP